MSGNSAALGARFRSGRLADRAAASLRRPLFLVGLFAGYLWILRAPTHRGCASILLIEALLLTVFAFLLAREGSPEAQHLLPILAFAALPFWPWACRMRRCGRLAARHSRARTSREFLIPLQKSTALAVISREEQPNQQWHSQSCRAALVLLCPGRSIGQRRAPCLPSRRFVPPGVGIGRHSGAFPFHVWSAKPAREVTPSADQRPEGLAPEKHSAHGSARKRQARLQSAAGKTQKSFPGARRGCQ